MVISTVSQTEADHNDAIYLNLLKRDQPAVIQFWIDGMSDVWINDVAISPGHSIFVAGSYFRFADGSENHFLAHLYLTGQALQVTNLGQYEAEEIWCRQRWNCMDLWARLERRAAE